MDTTADIAIARTASWEVFQHLGTTLERAPAEPARARARVARPSPLGVAGLLASDDRWATSWRDVDVVIAHASPIVAEGLLTTLSRHTSARVLICDGEDALRARVASPSPCLVFSDHATAVAGARRLAPGSPCAWACVTTLDRDADIRGALGAGVFGYLLADCAISDYVDCVQSVGREARFLCQRARRRLSEPSPHPGLSVRETAVLRLVVDGLSNQDIGEQLHISLSTVKVHVRSILKKLGARSRTQAAARAGALALLGGRTGS